MSWWSDLLSRLLGPAGEDEDLVDDTSLPSNEPPLFECQVCFKIFESTESPPVCSECDSVDVKLLTA
jgi:hypothetical protein